MRYTNHSLRATAITRMFTSGIEEKIIAETSGHKSTKVLRAYERTSEQQRKHVTSIINQTEMPVVQPECNLGASDVMSTVQSNSTNTKISVIQSFALVVLKRSLLL